VDTQELSVADDTRELILARLFAIVEAMDWIATAERNRTEFDDTQLPAGSVLEGDEEVLEGDVGRSRPSARPYLVMALPQVFLRAATDNENVGTNLNRLRLWLIRTIINDPELNRLSANGHRIRYAGQQSTLHAARSMVGAVALMFQITYVLYPNDV
jgi:hypothetical protein